MNGSQEVNFMVEMSFCGTRYHGFQKQKNGIATIQQTVEEGIFRLLGERAEINSSFVETFVPLLILKVIFGLCTSTAHPERDSKYIS